MLGTPRSTGTPTVIVVDPSVMSPPPPVTVTVPSSIDAPPDVLSRNHDAVPPAAGFAGDGSAADNAAPAADHDPPTVIDTSSVPVAAVSAVAGRAPERISMTELLPSPEATAVAIELARELETVSAM